MNSWNFGYDSGKSAGDIDTAFFGARALYFCNINVDLCGASALYSCSIDIDSLGTRAVDFCNTGIGFLVIFGLYFCSGGSAVVFQYSVQRGPHPAIFEKPQIWSSVKANISFLLYLQLHPRLSLLVPRGSQLPKKPTSSQESMPSFLYEKDEKEKSRKRCFRSSREFCNQVAERLAVVSDVHMKESKRRKMTIN